MASWLDARSRGARWLVRVEDLDWERCSPEKAAANIDDLAWLGMTSDAAPMFQSQRLGHYRAALNQLAARGELFACTCSRKTLHDAGPGAPHGSEGPPYPGTCRGNVLRVDDLPEDRAPGSRPVSLPFSVRWRVPLDLVTVSDALRGEWTESLPQSCGDIVLLRRDGLWSYQLACVVDDAAQVITDVVRGEDLLASTARQQALARAMKLVPPSRYVHVPLLLDADGKRMAKRSGSETLAAWRASGRTPSQALAALAQSLGLATPEDTTSIGALIPAWTQWLAANAGRSTP